MNLTDLLLNQNNGATVDALSRQFGLSQDQTVQAIEALMPAFSQGLKRNTQSAGGAAALIEALAHGQHGRYVDTPEYATASAGVKDGNAILGHLFGNKDVSRAVASHASASTGIGASLLKKMLPVLANMVMGSLFKGATSGRRGSGGLGGAIGSALGGAAGGGILGQIIEGLAGGALGGALGGQTSQRRRAPRGTGGSGSLEDLLGGMLGGGTRRTPRRRGRVQDPVMPAPRRRQRQGGGLEDIFDQLAGGSGRRRRTNPYAPKPAQRQRRGPRGGLNDIFGDMLEPGGNTQPEYRSETGSVFDQFLGPSR